MVRRHDSHPPFPLSILLFSIHPNNSVPPQIGTPRPVRSCHLSVFPRMRSLQRRILSPTTLPFPNCFPSSLPPPCPPFRSPCSPVPWAFPLFVPARPSIQYVGWQRKPPHNKPFLLFFSPVFHLRGGRYPDWRLPLVGDPRFRSEFVQFPLWRRDDKPFFAPFFSPLSITSGPRYGYFSSSFVHPLSSCLTTKAVGHKTRRIPLPTDCLFPCFSLQNSDGSSLPFSFQQTSRW